MYPFHQNKIELNFITNSCTPQMQLISCLQEYYIYIKSINFIFFYFEVSFIKVLTL